MSMNADELQSKALTHEEISRLGGRQTAKNMGPRKLKARAKKASALGQIARANCKHPADRRTVRKDRTYCTFCGRRIG